MAAKRFIVGLTVVLAALSTTRTHAAHEDLAVYEDWTGGTVIRGDRWFGGSDAGLERRREIQDDKLVMRLRRAGGTASDVGATGFFSNRLNLARPLTVDALEVEFRVRNVEVTRCDANSTPSLARAAAIDLNRINDLGPGAPRVPGSVAGDHIARVEAFRASNSTARNGILAVRGIVFRCNDAGCTSSTVLTQAPLGEVKRGAPFRLRLVWDQAGHRFLAGLNQHADVPLPYAADVHRRDPNAPAALIRIQHLPANCTAGSGGPTTADAETEVRQVLTNASALIP
jgi:hypothetical protein